MNNPVTEIIILQQNSAIVKAGEFGDVHSNTHFHSPEMNP